MASTGEPEADTAPVDDYGAAILEDGGAAATLAVPGDDPATPAAPTYPPFHPEAWRDHPIARLINSGADAMSRAPPGTAARCTLGESYVYAISCYTGGNKDMPPWAVAIIATGHFVFAVVIARRAQAPTAGDDKTTRALAERVRAGSAGGPTHPTADGPG